jgi:hypothetical protein
MNPELKAWIDSICNSGTRHEQHMAQGFHGLIQNSTRSQNRLLAFFANVVGEITPNACESARMRQRNGDIGEYCRRRDAIAYHGLW